MEKSKLLTFFLPFLFFLAFFRNISITSFDIKDNVFASYIIAPILSLPFFLLFSFKEKQKEDSDFSKIFAISSFLVLASLILQIYLEVKFSYLFYAFRLDLVAIPFFIAIFCLLVFNSVNVKAILFSLLSIPAFFLPIFIFRNYFNALNILIVSPFASFFGLKQDNEIFSKNGISIAIKEECTSPSIFLAFFAFILLISYFFNGSKKNKLAFIIFSFFLLFFLNLLRILLILWFLSNGKVQHITGVPFFYLGMAISIFSFKKFGLEEPKIEIRKIKIKRVFSIFLFSILFLLLQNPRQGLSFEKLEELGTLSINSTQPLLNHTGFSTSRGFQFYYINDSYVLLAQHKLFCSEIDLLKYQFINISNLSKIVYFGSLLFDNFSAELYDFSIQNQTFCAIFAESYSHKGFFSVAILNNQKTNEEIKVRNIGYYPIEYKQINNRCIILLKKVLEMEA